MKYSLANYILSITPNDQVIRNMFGVISIGGEGSYVGSVSFSRQASTFSTESYATGAWVHNKNLSRIGNVVVQLNQLSEQVSKFILLCETFLIGDYEGFTITLSTNDGVKVASAIDAYIEKVPDQTFENSATNQSWSFTCGQVNFK